MRGEAGVPLELNCGSRNAGWLGSFQIEYSETSEPKWRATRRHEFLEVEADRGA